jgi:hypothetical protein
MGEAKSAYLVDVVEVDRDRRVRCQAEGCGHSVYARIHILLVGAQFQVLGGNCFQRLYGRVLQDAKSYYGGSVGSPTRLDEDMRLLLATNTAEFVGRLEARRLELEALAETRPALVQNKADRPAVHDEVPPAATGGEDPSSRQRSPVGKAGFDPPSFVYVFDDPSVAAYEGRAVLRWQWLKDKATVASRLAAYKASPAPGTNQDIVARCYEQFAHKTPYLFVLAVEYVHFMPKKNTLRALDELGLIEQV